MPFNAMLAAPTAGSDRTATTFAMRFALSIFILKAQFFECVGKRER
jgi:hypothetical protein